MNPAYAKNTKHIVQTLGKLIRTANNIITNIIIIKYIIKQTDVFLKDDVLT